MTHSLESDSRNEKELTAVEVAVICLLMVIIVAIVFLTPDSWPTNMPSPLVVFGGPMIILHKLLKWLEAA